MLVPDVSLVPLFSSDEPVVPTAPGLVVPDVPAPVVLFVPVVLPVRARVRLRVVDRDVPRRVADVRGAHGTWSTAPTWLSAICPSATVPVRLLFAVALALPDAALPVALFVSPVAAVPDAFEPLRRPRAVALPDVADGVQGVACAPVCTPAEVVVPEVPCVEPWRDRVDGDDVDGDDVLPLPYCASAGTASARLSATLPAHVIEFLLT